MTLETASEAELISLGGMKLGTCVDIHTKVVAISRLRSMLLPELVEDICCIKASIVTELPGDDLKSLGIRIDEQLRLASNCASMVSQKPANQPIVEQNSAAILAGNMLCMNLCHLSALPTNTRHLINEQCDLTHASTVNVLLLVQLEVWVQ